MTTICAVLQRRYSVNLDKLRTAREHGNNNHYVQRALAACDEIETIAEALNLGDHLPTEQRATIMRDTLRSYTR